MQTDKNVYVAGHNGMVGSAIVRALKKHGYTNLILKSKSELDLTNQSSVNKFFEAEKPDYVYLAAAKVGGILANNDYPADFIYQNLMIQTNIIHAAYINQVKRLLFLGSSCIYPKSSAQPINESSLLTNILEPTNEAYALAKITGIKMCEAYNRQFDCDFRSLMPTNLYGPNDNYDLNNSHVIPALLNKFHTAKIMKYPTVTVWGTGKPMREFLHVDDLATACLHMMQLDKSTLNHTTNERLSHINIGTGKEISIEDLAKLIAEIVGYDGEICFDDNRPDGMMRKRLDITLINKLGWQPSIKLKDGLNLVYDDFQSCIVNS